MVWLSQDQITRAKARKVTLEARLVALDAVLDAGADSKGSYRFDSGEASQQVKNRSFDEIWTLIHNTEATLEHVCQKLNGTGITSLEMRRRG